LEYRDRTAPIGEPEAAACLAVHKALKAAGTSIERAGQSDCSPRPRGWSRCRR
jgi:hypothetical protein